MRLNKKNIPHFVYILQTKSGLYYTGVTKNIKERIKRHEDGRGSKCIRGKGPFRLVYCEQAKNLISAMRREREIKDMSRSKKEALVSIQRQLEFWAFF
jgi:putative endonuclease